ncbi:MAG: response regulator transcription factor [Phycisphaerae bacterium]|nr:response regulator transcription factor [Phycisphaerae bacterium]NIP52327.1 response regulator transcription factor [Phycisphaerae bacterium]NIW47252.1 response regulator [Gammaproteobacteria bacterium]NIX31008.1 response regulator [Phycisphaerae bacterium]
MTKPIRLLLADDHTIFRAGVRMLLDLEPDIEVVGEALEGSQAVDLTAKLRPDVVLMDIAMPLMDGLEATRHIKAECPNTHVLVLTMHRSDEYLFEMLKAGASGYVIKGAETEELINAIRVVARGQVFLYPSIAGKLVSEYLELSGTGDDPRPSLTPREKEIMLLLAEGYGNKEIADKLVISTSTVYTHRSKLMEKLGLTSRHELIQYARRKGLVRGL